MILEDQSDRSSLIRNLDYTSFLRQEDGAVGGVAARLEEGGKAGKELRLLDLGPVECGDMLGGYTSSILR